MTFHRQYLSSNKKRYHSAEKLDVEYNLKMSLPSVDVNHSRHGKEPDFIFHFESFFMVEIRKF